MRVLNGEVRNALLLPWFRCEDVLLLFLVVSVDFIDRVDYFYFVGEFPAFLGDLRLGIRSGSARL